MKQEIRFNTNLKKPDELVSYLRKERMGDKQRIITRSLENENKF